MDSQDKNCQDIKTKYKDRNSIYKNFLSLILTIFSIFYFSMFLFIKIPEENVRFIDTILGFLLGSVVSVIINYYYGSSVDDLRTNDHNTTTAKHSTDKDTNTTTCTTDTENPGYPKLP